MPFLNSSPLPSLSKHFKSQPKTGLDWKYNGSVSACAQNIKLAWEADRLDGASECCSFLVNQDVGVKRWSHHGKCWVRLQRATVSCSLSLSLSLPSPPLPYPYPDPTHHSYRLLLSLMVMAFTSVYSASAYSPLKNKREMGKRR